ncbi:MAG TPA: MFS transporter [Bacillota bacterium]
MSRIWTLPFALLWLVGLLSYAGNYLALPVLPLYLQEHLGWTPAVIGGLLSLKNVVAMASRPLVGWLTDAHGRRRFLLLGTFGLGATTLAVPFLQAAAPFGLVRAASGVSWGMLTATANTLAGDLAPSQRRGHALGLYTMAGSLALACAPAAGLHLVEARGYPFLFFLAGGIGLLATLGTLLLRDPPGAAGSPTAFALGNLYCLPAVGPAFVLMLHSMTYGAVIIFLPIHAQARGLTDVGGFFTIYAACLVVLRGMAGRLSDRFSRPGVMIPGLCCGALSMALLAVADHPWHLYAAAVALGLAMALVQPPALAWGLDLAGGRRGTAMATMVAAQDLGITLGGGALGLIAGVAGIGSMFSLAALLPLGGSLLLWTRGRSAWVAAN